MHVRRWFVLLGLLVVACSGPVATPAGSATSESQAPAASPTFAATTLPSEPAAPSFSVPRAALAAVRRFDLALIAAQSGGELTQSDYRAYEPHLVILRLSLGDGSVPLAKTNYAALRQQVARDAAKLAGPLGRVVTRDFELLGTVLDATPLGAGAIPAGAHYTTTFAPGILLTFDAGWSVVIEDASVVAIARNGITLAFTHQASEVTSAAVERILEAGAGVRATPSPSQVVVGAFHGWSAGVVGGGALWSSADGRAHEAAAGSTVRAWVLEVNRKPLTIVADGSSAAMTAIAAELDALLGTFLAP